MGDNMAIINSPLLWFAGALVVGWVVFQALVFMVKSLRVRKQIGISDEQLRSAVKTSVTSSIGPSFVVVVGMVSLLVAMGGPISWFRMATIGAVGYEMMAAGFTADAVGVTLGGANMNATAVAAYLWVATFASLGWIIFTGIFTDKMDKFRNVLAGGRKALLPIIAVAAMAGAFGYMAIDRVFNPSLSQTVAVIGGFAAMAAFSIYNKKAQKKWIKEWSFTISMFAGMLLSVPFVA